MKRFLSTILLLCMIWGCVVSAALADPTQETTDQLGDQAAAYGVDLVIVLDMTGSMDESNQGKRGNDIHKYRFDAAAMLIGMLDMNGSRVAVVPFAQAPLYQYESLMTLTDVTSEETRKRIVETIYGMKVSGATNIGTALMKANMILNQRGDSKNEPMIILLTDGQNDMRIDGKEPSKVEREVKIAPSGEIVEGQATQYTTNDANRVTRDAVGYAKDKGYPIYTVALGVNTKATSTATSQGNLSLEQISAETDAECIPVQPENANQLPVKFAEILAKRIGSSVQTTMQPEWNNGKNRYEVLIPIVNGSIQETNIVVMVKNPNEDKKEIINSNTIQVELEGREKPEGSVVVLNPGGHYVMVKIRPQGATGKWTMSFSAGDGGSPDAVSFNVLYNYNIKLDAGLSARNQDQEFHKNDTLHLSAFFRKEDGTMSDDPELYVDHKADYEGTGYADKVTIHAYYAMYRWDSQNNEPGALLIDRTEMTGNPAGKSFEADIDLTQFSPLLKEGNYAFVIDASGAGMDTRECKVPFRITNQEPKVALDTGEYTNQSILVNWAYGDEPDKTRSWTVEGTSGKLEKTADEIVWDPDGERVDFYALEPVDGAEQPAEMVWDTDGNTILFKTKMNAAGDRVEAGDGRTTAEYWLYYDDGDGVLNRDPAQRVKLILPIVDLDVDLKGSYEPVLAIYDKDNNQTTEFKKNTPVTIRIGLKKCDGSGYDNEVLKLLNPMVTVTDPAAIGTGRVPFRDGDPAEEEEFLVYTVETTGNQEASWNVSAVMNPFEELTATVTIPNKAGPVPVNSPADDVDLYCGRNWKLPLVGDMYHDNTPEDDEHLTVTVNDSMFTDSDGDVLTYDPPKFYDKNGEEIDPEKIHAEPVEVVEADDGSGRIKSGEYKIVYSGNSTGWLMNWSFDAEMRITAHDGNDKQGNYVQKFTVTNVRNQERFLNLVILAAAVLLTILILIVHQARKPKFPTLNMTIREEPSLFNTSSETLSPVKSPTNVNAMGVDGDMAARHNISMEPLQNIVIKPIRSQSAVGVVCKKMFGGHEVTLEDVALKAKKQHTWRLEEELVIRNINGEGMIAIKLEDRRGESDEDFAGALDFGGEDSWVDSSAGFTDTTYSGGKRTRRVKKKAAAPAEEEQSFTNDSSDGFDF